MFAFRPRLIDALQDYDRVRFMRDVGAGLTVGVVALPLAMAFAIASGLKPEAGLITAVVAVRAMRVASLTAPDTVRESASHNGAEGSPKTAASVSSAPPGWLDITLWFSLAAVATMR